MKSLFVCILLVFFINSSAQNRPNVIFVIFDDLNDAVEGLGGHPQSKTPNLDKLMNKGMRFTRAYCNSSLCAPSRASLLTGVYPHTSGCFNAEYNPAIGKNWRELPPLDEVKTIMETFKDNGYSVYGTGKIFHNGEEDWSVWLDPVKGEMNFGHYPSWGPYPYDGKTPFKPFFVSHTGVAKHPSFPDVFRLGFFTHLADIPVVQPNESREVPGYTGWWEFGRPFHYKNENDRDLMADELSAQWVSNLLNEEIINPFLICVGINRPHGPWIAPKKYFDMFPKDSIRLANVNENDLDDIPDILKSSSYINKRAKLYHEYKKKGYDVQWTQAYLACVAYADAQFGKILSAVENSKYADNTLIVVISDHGFHMGEKLRYYKFSVWEEANRIPMIFAGPGIDANQTCETPVSLIDIYPTLTDYCNLKISSKTKKNLEGKSLTPLLKNPEKAQWEGPPIAVSVVGYNRDSNWSEMDHHFTARSKNFRYTLCSNGEEELYDHRTDLLEWYNLALSPDYSDIKRKMKEELVEIIKTSDYKPQY